MNRIIHEQDYPNYMILEYSAKHDCWEIHSTYPNKEQRNEVLSALLQDEKIILD